MEIPTLQTQMKLAEILYELDGCQPEPFETSDRKADYVTKAAFALARLMKPISQDMFPAVRADEREKVAFHIVAELVCCDIHARMEAEAAKGHWDDVKHEYVMPQSWYDLKKSTDHHAICRYGGWAAALAFEGWRGTPHEGWFKPWLIHGTTQAPKGPRVCKANGGEAECKPTYWCPTAGEYESPCHGGFDNCCSRPDEHRPFRGLTPG